MIIMMNGDVLKGYNAFTLTLHLPFVYSSGCLSVFQCPCSWGQPPPEPHTIGQSCTWGRGLGMIFSMGKVGAGEDEEGEKEGGGVTEGGCMWYPGWDGKLTPGRGAARGQTVFTCMSNSR